MKLWIRNTRINLAKDESLKNVLGIAKPKTFDWFMHEASLRRLPALSLYQGYVFPPELPDEYYEPIGILYGRHKDLERVRQQLSSWVQLSSSELSVDATDEVPSPPNLLPSPSLDKIPNSAAVQMPNACPVTESVAGSPDSNHSASKNSPIAAFPYQKEYSSQANWSRRPGSMSQHRVSISNQYLYEGKELNDCQKRAFWEAVRASVKFHQPNQTHENIAETAMQSFNERGVLMA
jgi:hypothetical protein